MTKLALYDPPMCCSTGVCGPAVDPVLPRVTADLDWLKRQGVEVERYNPGEAASGIRLEPDGHLRPPRAGQRLPALVLVDGEVVSCGTYPDRAELLSARGPRCRYRD